MLEADGALTGGGRSGTTTASTTDAESGGEPIADPERAWMEGSSSVDEDEEDCNTP